MLAPSTVSNFREQIHARFETGVYQAHARDAGFGLRFGEKTCFDHATNELVIGVEQLLSLGVKDINELDFAVLHEIKHYLDMREDPESYTKLLAKGDRSDGLGDLYFRLYNCTEDVAVNVRNAHDSALFRGVEKDTFSPLVEALYKTKLFKNRDFQAADSPADAYGLPLCAQYASYVLNLGMGVAQDITVAPEVREIIECPIDVYGRKISLAEFVAEYLQPAPPTERAKTGNSLAQRLRIVEDFLEPRFQELLEIDKKQRGEDALKNLSPDIQFGSPQGSSREDLKKALGRVLSDKAHKNKTPAERAREMQEKQQAAAGDRAGLSPKENKDFVERLQRLEPTIDEIARLWLTIPQVRTEQTRHYVGHYPTGIRPDIRKVIARFPDIELGKENVAVMQRREERNTLQISPKKLRVRLVVDASSSMKDHMAALADIALALSVSFIKVNTIAEIEDKEFQCQDQVLTFGENAREILPFAEKRVLEEAMRAYKSFFQYEDSTQDHLALQLIKNSLNRDDKALRESGELFDLLIEITDGATSNPHITKKLIRELEGEGLILHAIGIGQELGRFEDIWNSGGRQRGKKVSGIRELLPTLRGFVEEHFPAQKAAGDAAGSLV